MSWAAVAAAVVVGITFVVAGASKLAVRDGWRASARELGAPDWTVPIVPWVEVAVGASLAVRLVMPLPAIAAAALIVAFTVLIALRLREGERPPCACFGQWSATPVGPRHIVRNVVLFVLAVIAAV